MINFASYTFLHCCLQYWIGHEVLWYHPAGSPGAVLERQIVDPFKAAQRGMGLTYTGKVGHRRRAGFVTPSPSLRHLSTDSIPLQQQTFEKSL